MKYSSTRRSLAVIVLAFAAIAGLATYQYSKPTQAQTANSGVHEVALGSDEAKGAIVFVKLGESVQFNSRDGKGHYIGSGRGEEIPHEHGEDQAAHEADGHEHTPGLNSGPFGPNEGYLVTFSKAGTYEFHDHFNPAIRITVVVYRP